MTDNIDADRTTDTAWTVSLRLDKRDIIGGVGIVLMAGGLAWVHVGLAAAAIGLGLFGFAWSKSR